MSRGERDEIEQLEVEEQALVPRIAALDAAYWEAVRHREEAHRKLESVAAELAEANGLCSALKSEIEELVSSRKTRRWGVLAGALSVCALYLVFLYSWVLTR